MHPVVESRSAAMDTARCTVLEAVCRDAPLPVSALPARWPVTRQQLRSVAMTLSQEGLLEVTRAPRTGVPLLSLTRRGRAALRAG